MAQPNVQNMEIKEKPSPDQFKQMLHHWIDAWDANQDFEFTLRNQHCVVPKEVWSRGKMEVEYEVEDGEYELEFKVKGRA